jgi:hypothetical protein
MGDGAAVDVNGTLTDTGIVSLGTSFYFASTLTSLTVGGLTILGGGAATSYANSSLAIIGKLDIVAGGTFDDGGAVTLGDGSDAGVMVVTPGSVLDLTDDSGIAPGNAAAALATNQGLFEKTGGTGTSTISVSFTNSGQLEVASGTLLFSGASNDFSGALTGAGAITFAGGHTSLMSGLSATVTDLSATGSGDSVALVEDFEYGGDFTLGAGTRFAILGGDALTLTGTGAIGGDIGGGALDIAGGTTTLDSGGGVFTSSWTVSGAGTDAVIDEPFTYAGTFALNSGATLTTEGPASGAFVLTAPATLADATVEGGERFVTRDSAAVSSLTLGLATVWDDEGVVTQSGAELWFDPYAALLITSGSAYDLTDDNGFGELTSALVTNRGLLEKSAGTGVSAIATTVLNTGTIEAASGRLDLESAVSGAGADTISGAATLEFDSTAALTQTIGFTGAGGTLDIASPGLFSTSSSRSAPISGFDTAGVNDMIEVGGPWTFAGFAENVGGTQGTLMFADGAAQIGLTLLGDYSPNQFHAMASATATDVTYD